LPYCREVGRERISHSDMTGWLRYTLR